MREPRAWRLILASILGAAAGAIWWSWGTSATEDPSPALCTQALAVLSSDATWSEKQARFSATLAAHRPRGRLDYWEKRGRFLDFDGFLAMLDELASDPIAGTALHCEMSHELAQRLVHERRGFACETEKTARACLRAAADPGIAPAQRDALLAVACRNVSAASADPVGFASSCIKLHSLRSEKRDRAGCTEARRLLLLGTEKDCACATWVASGDPPLDNTSDWNAPLKSCDATTMAGLPVLWHAAWDYLCVPPSRVEAAPDGEH